MLVIKIGPVIDWVVGDTYRYPTSTRITLKPLRIIADGKATVPVGVAPRATPPAWLQTQFTIPWARGATPRPSSMMLVIRMEGLRLPTTLKGDSMVVAA